MHSKFQHSMYSMYSIYSIQGKLAEECGWGDLLRLDALPAWQLKSILFGKDPFLLSVTDVH